MHRYALALGAWLTTCGFSTEVCADDLSGARFQPTEVRHRVRVILGRGSAKLFVERTVYNPGKRPDEAVFSVDVPEGAVATSLKTLGTLGGKPHWFMGELREAEEAASMYRKLTGRGGFYPKDPALLSWRAPTELLLQVFPCMPKQNKVVGYTLELPMTYSAGRYRIELGPLGLLDQPAGFTVEPANPGDRLFLENTPLQTGRLVTLDEPKELAVEPYRPPSVSGELAVADTGLGKSFTHVRFALSRKLSEVPVGAHVVLALDHSRSMGPRRNTAVTMAESVLRLFRQPQVQILDYDRRPHARFSGFASAEQALSSLRRERQKDDDGELSNGSDIDLALAEAERRLATLPDAVPKRILVFTDALSPSRILPRDLEAAVGKSGAIVHIIQVDSASPERLERDDAHPWAAATRLTGGLFWTGQSSPNEEDPTENPYLRLVRPTTLDHVTYSDSANPDATERIDTLGEGSGIERQGLYEGDVRWARLTGELWSRPFRMTVHPDRDASKLWSALVFGTDERELLSEPEMMVLAKRGGAVSPVTSYLAIEPGVRPSTEGLDDGGAFGAGDLGLSGIGESGGGHGEGVGTSHLEPFDPEAFLTQQLTEKWAACRAKLEPKASFTPDTTTVTLETHFVEVADVKIALNPGTPEHFECLTEAAWSLDLRGHRFEDSKHTWEILL